MSAGSRVRRNSVLSLLSFAARLGSSFLLFVGIARIYGPESFGQFTTANAVMALFLILADLGLDTLLALEVARSQSTPAAVLSRYAALKAAIALAATVVMVTIGLFRPFDETTSLLIIILGASVVFSAMMNFEFALLRGLEQFHQETQVTIIINVAALGLLALVGFLRAPLTVVALVYALTRVAGYLLARHRASRVLGVPRMRLTFSGLQEVKGKALLFAAHLLFGYLFFQVDTLLLAALKGSADVGVYQAVFKVVAVALVIPDVGVAAMLPTLARLHHDAPDQWLDLGALMGRVLLLIGLPISMVMLVYPECVLGVLYGAGTFPEAVTIMRIFAGVVWIRFIAEAFGLLLTTSGNQSLRVIITAVATILNVGVNLAVIPAMGPAGAAMVSLGTNILVAAGCLIAIRRSYPLPVVGWRTGTVVALTAAIAGLVWTLRELPLCASLPVSVAACVLLGLYVGLTRDERRKLFSFRIPARAEGPA